MNMLPIIAIVLTIFACVGGLKACDYEQQRKCFADTHKEDCYEAFRNHR